MFQGMSPFYLAGVTIPWRILNDVKIDLPVMDYHTMRSLLSPVLWLL